MDPNVFTQNCNGEIVRTQKGNPAFLPRPLPPEVNLGKPRILDILLTTAEVVAALNQTAHDIQNPMLIASISNVFATVEARLSSKIEGIHTTTVDLLLAQQEEEYDDDAENVRPRASAPTEARNYTRAIRRGQARLKDPEDIPICNRLIRDLHRDLLEGVRGKNKNPGEFRREQNAIGREGDSEETALYVPPPPQLMLEAMARLEEFINTDQSKEINIYVRAAMVHYQFETIHPFMDGNGRVGRLLIILMFLDESKLEHALIYPSAFYDSHQVEYYERLMRVSTHGEWEEWIIFFLTGIASQASDAIRRIELARNLHQRYREEYITKNQPGQLLGLIDHLFGNPVVTPNSVMKLGMTKDTAYRYLRILEEDGVLIATKPKGQRNRAFVALDILHAIENG